MGLAKVEVRLHHMSKPVNFKTIFVGGILVDVLLCCSFLAQQVLLVD